jgi:hypothetical protein
VAVGVAAGVSVAIGVEVAVAAAVAVAVAVGMAVAVAAAVAVAVAVAVEVAAAVGVAVAVGVLVGAAAFTVSVIVPLLALYTVVPVLPPYDPVIVGVPVAVGVKVTEQLPFVSVHEVPLKVPVPVVLQFTVPTGTLLGVVESVTVAVHVDATLITPGFETHTILVAVVSPASTVTLPVEVSSLNMPLHVAPPGMQSLTFELNEAEASVSPSIPMTWFAVAPRPLRGNEASRNTAAPLLQAA